MTPGVAMGIELPGFGGKEEARSIREGFLQGLTAYGINLEGGFF